MPDPLLDIKNATLWRGDTCVFDSLNVSVALGESVAILGPNGSGKTTLLKVLNRELYPVDTPNSHVRLLGKEHWNVWELRKQIGIVSQDLQLAFEPADTALEVTVSGFFSSIGVQGTLASRITDEHLKRSAVVLRSLQMGDLLHTPLKAMSTGQQRRCLLARSMVHRPSTLILDEPCSGLDFAAAFDMVNQIDELAAAEHNVILVTHHLADIPPSIDRVILLSQGKIVADGPKRDVLTDALLGEVYTRSIQVIEMDGYFMACPGK